MLGVFLDGNDWPLFGLLFAFSCQTCPKFALVRTTFPLFLQNLSEDGLCSDYFPPFPAKPVRSWLLFGLLFDFSSQTCPKFALVRTTFRLFLQNLSEVGPSSDYFSSFPPKPVRTWPLFGLLFLFSTKPVRSWT